MAAPLPVNFKGTPQQWFESMLARMSLLGLPVGFIESDAMPTSNQGPWLKSGKEIWVWDEDVSTYVPQSLSFLTQQIWIGNKDTPPDATKFQIWLKTDGATFVGWAVWLGAFVGWVTQNNLLADSSVTTAMLGKPCVFRDNIGDGEVIASKIQNELPVNKLANGAADQVLRTSSDGATAAWDYVLHEGPEHAWTNSSGDSFNETHGLGYHPRYVRLVLVCKTAEIGYSVGDEVEVRQVYKNDATHYFDGLVFSVACNTTLIKVTVVAGTTVTMQPGGNPTPSKWRLKLYWAK